MLSETAIAVPGSCQVSSLSVDEFDIKIISNISNKLLSPLSELPYYSSHQLIFELSVAQ